MNRLEQIRERVEKATPGGWYVSDYFNDGFGAQVAEVVADRDTSTEAAIAHVFESNNPEWEHNADIIAHAPTDIPYLLSLAEDMQAVVDWAAEQDCEEPRRPLPPPHIEDPGAWCGTCPPCLARALKAKMEGE